MLSYFPPSQRDKARKRIRKAFEDRKRELLSGDFLSLSDPQAASMLDEIESGSQ